MQPHRARVRYPVGQYVQYKTAVTMTESKGGGVTEMTTSSSRSKTWGSQATSSSLSLRSSRVMPTDCGMVIVECTANVPRLQSPDSSRPTFFNSP
eukprot:g12412.t1